MHTDFEVIRQGGKPFVLVPMKSFEKLVRTAEEKADIQAFDQALQRLSDGEDERIPFTLVEARLRGESALKLWREYRDLTQMELAKRSGTSREMIAAIEAGTKKGSIATLKKLASALNIYLEQLA